MWEWFMPPINMVIGGWFMIYGIVLPTLLLLFAYLHRHFRFHGFHRTKYDTFVVWDSEGRWAGHPTAPLPGR